MLTAGEGRIVQNSSVLGLVAMKYRGAYNASKFALEGYTDTLRLELTGQRRARLPDRTRPHRHPVSRQCPRRLPAPHRSEREPPSGPPYAQTLARLEREGAWALPCRARPAYPPLLHALRSKRPKHRYPVTFPTRLFAVLRRLLPSRWLDRLLIKSA